MVDAHTHTHTLIIKLFHIFTFPVHFVDGCSEFIVEFVFRAPRTTRPTDSSCLCVSYIYVCNAWLYSVFPPSHANDNDNNNNNNTSNSSDNTDNKHNIWNCIWYSLYLINIYEIVCLVYVLFEYFVGFSAANLCLCYMLWIPVYISSHFGRLVATANR